MQAECPHCHTIFELEKEQFDQAQGQLRCGHCLAVFTMDAPFEDTQKDFLDETEKEQLELTEAIPEENTSETLADVIPPELREETRNPKQRYGFISTIFWAQLILIMLIIGIVQYAYYDRIRLSQFNELRPWMGLMCKYTKCNFPEPRNPDLIELSNKNIFSHPNIEKALMVSGSIINQATFAQAFPLLELKFENVRGETISGRRFTPEEYLGIPADQIPAMMPGISTSIKIEIIDPGKEMVSYTFEFL